MYSPSKQRSPIDLFHSERSRCHPWLHTALQTGRGHLLNFAGKDCDLTFDLLPEVETSERRREARAREMYGQPCGVLQMAEAPSS